ncbi:Ig-like domain-containing protein [Wenzhouxiangella sediminis]|uniref:Tandem-95 repeat protein n=1 Tax=Wenzhouxiangella sediminis TaxID=1792836 RepID=A0A3E1K5H4_9GAMM|nr:Ig-like domain-containing protein [Wenzhouxiangella sediminis]RFF29297.1 tandem-95 repeat protein [Wenzhouxiangella sediminis]
MSKSCRPRIKLRGTRVAPIGAAVGVAVSSALNAQTPPEAVDDNFEVVKRNVWQAAGNVFDNDTAVNPFFRSISSLDVRDAGYVFRSSGDVTYRRLYEGRCAATSDRFEYEMEDDSGLNVTAELQVTLLPPVQTDTYQVQAGQTLTEDVQANDPMPINPLNVVDQLNVTDFLAPGFGTVNQSSPGVVNQTGQFTYQPDPGFSGNDSFVYLTADPDTGCDWNTEVNVLVLPTAVTDSASTPGGQQVCNIDVLGNDLGSGLSLVNVTQPVNGTVSISGDDTLCFTPDQGFLGLATFAYTIEDTNGSQVDGSVEVDVFNLPPVLVDDSYQVNAGQSLSGNVFDNDSDPNGDSLSASLATPPADGNVVLDPDGAFTYTPDAGFSGSDGFSYSATDALRGAPPTANVAIVVVPVVVDTVVTGSTEQEVSGNLLDDAQGSGLTVTGWTEPSIGTLTVNPHGSYTFVAPPGFTGTVEFQFTAEDAFGSQVQGSVSLGFALAYSVPGPGAGGLGLLALLLGWLGFRRLR